MKKKGFTLVELLAVIAILAILVIIALPNVLGMFRSAQKSTFTTELQNIMRGAQNQYMSDTLKTTGLEGIAYGRAGGARCEGDDSNGKAPNGGKVTLKQLDLSGTSALDYYIEFNSTGRVIKFYATDGKYQFAYHGTKGLDIEKLSNELQYEIDEESGVDLEFYNSTPTNMNEVLKKLTPTQEENLSSTYARVLTISDGLEYCTNAYQTTGGTTNNAYKTSYGADDPRPCKFQYLAIQPGNCNVGIKTKDNTTGVFKVTNG